jgi:hypothetical protein
MYASGNVVTCMDASGIVVTCIYASGIVVNCMYASVMLLPIWMLQVFIIAEESSLVGLVVARTNVNVEHGNHQDLQTSPFQTDLQTLTFHYFIGILQGS